MFIERVGGEVEGPEEEEGGSWEIARERGEMGTSDASGWVRTRRVEVELTGRTGYPSSSHTSRLMARLHCREPERRAGVWRA